MHTASLRQIVIPDRCNCATNRAVDDRFGIEVLGKVGEPRFCTEEDSIYFDDKLPGEKMETAPRKIGVSSLSALKDIIAPLAVYAYFGGWIYAYYFYSSFGVRLYSLDIPAYYFIAYSFSVFYTVLGFIFIAMTGAAAAGLSQRPVALALCFLVLFVGDFYVARREGINSAYDQRFSTNDHERVILTFKQGAENSNLVDLRSNNDANRLRLLTETKDRIILFYQPPKIGKSIPLLMVYDLSKSDLLQIKRIIL